jgi:hypothetical protein
MKPKKTIAVLMLTIISFLGFHRVMAQDEGDSGGKCNCRIPNQNKYGRFNKPAPFPPDAECIIDDSCWLPLGD